jgi:hypothetical protein
MYCLRNTDKINADAPAAGDVLIYLMTGIIGVFPSPSNICFAKNIHLHVSSHDAISFVILYIEGTQAILSRENSGACRGKEEPCGTSTAIERELLYTHWSSG